MLKKDAPKRRAVGFKSSALDAAAQVEWIQNFKSNKEFHPSVPALVIDEAFNGCGIVVLNDAKLKVGTLLRIKVGQLPVLKAEVRWVQEVDEELTKCGLSYLE